MKSNKKILRITLTVLGSLVALFLIVVGLVLYKWKTNTSPCVPDIPERVGQIPSTAKWIGGCDGGHWFDIIEMKKEQNIYRIAIYFDYNGKLYVDGYFRPECNKVFQTTDELLSTVLYYEGAIRMKDQCDLIPVDAGNK